MIREIFEKIHAKLLEMKVKIEVKEPVKIIGETEKTSFILTGSNFEGGHMHIAMLNGADPVLVSVVSSGIGKKPFHSMSSMAPGYGMVECEWFANPEKADTPCRGHVINLNEINLHLI